MLVLLVVDTFNEIWEEQKMRKIVHEVIYVSFFLLRTFCISEVENSRGNVPGHEEVPRRALSFVSRKCFLAACGMPVVLIGGRYNGGHN